MKRILFGKLVEFEGLGVERVHDEGELIVVDGYVSEIRDRVSPEFDGETIDLSDQLLLPGFVNAHCHLSLSALKGKIEYEGDFVGWIRRVIELNQDLGLAERRSAMQQAASAMLKSGVTGVCDYISDERVMPVYESLPCDQLLFLEVIGFKESLADEALAFVRRFFDAFRNKSKRIDLGLAPHAPYSVSPRLFKEIGRLAKEWDCPVSCHVAESVEELEFLNTGGGAFLELLKDRGVFESNFCLPGKDPVSYLGGLGVLDGLQAVHLNHMSEYEAFGRSGASAVFCPGSTKYFEREEWMPVRELLDRGVFVGLGTDSLASNDSLDMIRELKLADEMLSDVSQRELLFMATVGGGSVWRGGAGVLSEGCAANLIGFDLPKTNESWWDVPFRSESQVVSSILIYGDRVEI